jgi:hypothetical protein
MRTATSLLGFEPDIWDYLTFVTLFLLTLAGGVFYCWLAGLPGRIAIACKHPDAEAVKLIGWAGLLPTIYPWVQAFIWAFKPTDIVDIRRFPREEQRAIEEDIARLSGKTPTMRNGSYWFVGVLASMEKTSMIDNHRFPLFQCSKSRSLQSSIVPYLQFCNPVLDQSPIYSLLAVG